MERTAQAKWEGNLREGHGNIKLGSGAFEGAYSFATRFESGKGTNPEELLGAAHAACFSMALSVGLVKAGHAPRSLIGPQDIHRGRSRVGENPCGIRSGGLSSRTCARDPSAVSPRIEAMNLLLLPSARPCPHRTCLPKARRRQVGRGRPPSRVTGA